MSTNYVPATFAANPTPTQLNAELEKIRVALAETLHRLGTVDNGMEEDLDLNGHEITNAAAGTTPGSLVTVDQLNQVVPGSDSITQVLADIAALQAYQAFRDSTHAGHSSDISALQAEDVNILANLSGLFSDVNGLDFNLSQLEDKTLSDEKHYNFIGTPPSGGVRVGNTVMGRPQTFKAAGPHFARSVGGATAAAAFVLQKNGTQFGTVDYPAGQTSGSVTIPVDTAFAAGDSLEILTGNMNGLATPFFTLTSELT